MMRQQCSASSSPARQPAVVGSVLGALVCVALAVVAATAQSSFILGVFVGVDEHGGQLLPVARFDGRVWTNSWPSPDSEAVAINRLDQIPRAWLGSRPPRVWTTWKAGGRTSQVRISGVSRIGGTGELSGCTAAVVLNTPYGGVIPEEGTLAFDNLQRVEAVVDVTIPSDEARRTMGRLSELFTAAEEATLRREEWQFSLSSDGPRHPLSLPARDRASATIVLLKLYRAQKAAPGAPSIYLVEALKGFPWEASTLGGGDRLFFSGWIAVDGDRMKAIEVSAGVDFSNDGHATRVRPLGILSVAGRTVWVVDLAQYESGLVQVLDVSAAEIRVLASAQLGGC